MNSDFAAAEAAYFEAEHYNGQTVVSIEGSGGPVEALWLGM